jgi:hypothetical protein
MSGIPRRARGNKTAQPHSDDPAFLEFLKVTKGSLRRHTLGLSVQKLLV